MGFCTSNIPAAISRARRLCKRERAPLAHTIVRVHAQGQGGRTADQRQQVRVAHKAGRKALVHLKSLLERERADALLSVVCIFTPPPPNCKECGSTSSKLAVTLGAKAREPCALLQRLSDHQGGLISTQRSTILRRLHQHRGAAVSSRLARSPTRVRSSSQTRCTSTRRSMRPM